MQKLKSALASAAAMVAVVAPAAARAPLGPDQVEPGVYVVDSKETLARYGVMHMGFSEFWGTFPGATGTLTVDPKAIAATKVDIKIPIATVETTNRELNGELFSDEFFDGETHPSMHFVSTSVTRTGLATARLAGDLTMHGITRPVVFDVTFVGAGPNAFSKVPTVGFRAEGVVKRSDWGLGKYAPIVSDETTITISAAFEKR